MQTQEHPEEQELGNLLRYRRCQRGKSQLDLSPGTEISQRPLSFVDSGRSTPSKNLLMTVGTPQSVTAQELRIERMFPLDTENTSE